MDSASPAVVLATKLHIPAVTARLISRAPLVEALSGGKDRKLTLLSAPAGWGKTTLLAQWVAGEHDHLGVAWLSVDPADNDPVRFWMYVIAALRNTQPDVAARAFELLKMSADLQEAVLPTLLNELANFDGKITLILDDYHLVTSRVVHEQLTFVTDRMPASLRLVIATRADPSLPLARLRAGGDLLELRADDLRFAEIEACRLLNDVLELGLADDDITLLCRRTEGWAAGLYLVALSLAGRPDAREFIRAFAGDNRHIVDYLSAEVLDGLDAQLRGFLVRTSVLDRLSGALCDAVLDITGSATMLQRIERENMFVIPLDSSRGWYRYHHLFGELLRNELHRTQPDLVPVLHQRAGAWFRDAGHIDAAVRHLIAGGEVADAAELIAAHWATIFNRGRVSTVSGWLDLLPHHTVSSDARLSVARAWIALTTRHVGDADTWIDAAEAALAAGHVEAGTIPAELVILRAVSRFKTGAVAESLDLAGRATRLDLGDSPLDPSTAYCIYGSALYFSDRVEEARAAFCQAVPLAERVANHDCRVYALGYLAKLAVDRGQVGEAEHLIQQASGGGRDLAAGEFFGDMMVSLATAKILDLRGDAAAATDAARAAVVLARRGGGVLEVANALLAQAEIFRHSGDREAARAAVSEARMILRRSADAGPARELLATADLTPPSHHQDRSVGAEELTAKELDVLRLLASRLSRREIGEHLYVSVNTVKTHQRALYRKLGIADRAAAVQRGRELGIL